MHWLQDGMARVRALGNPDLFITITCNPNWPEITNALLPGQTPIDRPDIVARVFRQKLAAIKHLILHKHAFGEVLAYCDTIEFQKRGLPHCHLLLILSPEDKPATAEDVDRIVSAEIPDPQRLSQNLLRCILASQSGRFACDDLPVLLLDH